MDAAELQGELEMCQAMYGDSLTVTGVPLESLPRQSSFDLIDQDDDKPRSGGDDEDEDEITHNVITFTLRKNIKVSLTVPVAGYWAHVVRRMQQAKEKDEEAAKNNKSESGPSPIAAPKPRSAAATAASAVRPKLRCDVLSSPVCVDSDDLLQVMKQCVRDAAAAVSSDFSAITPGNSASALIIAVLQAAEQHVETVLSNLSSSSFSGDSNKNINNSGSSEDDDNENNNDDDDEAAIERSDGDSAVQQVSGMYSRAGSSSHSGATSSGVLLPPPDKGVAACPQHLVSRGLRRCSTVIADRGSKFIAHMCPISSEKEAMEVVAAVRDIKGISDCAHPCIYAYRFKSPHSQALHYDCDDDGEKGAAKNILCVMDSMGVLGWICAVSRIFGGIHLGPDRFKHICNVTRAAIVEAGAAEQVLKNAMAAMGASPSKKKKQ